MRINDAVTGGALLAGAVALALYARTLPPVPGQQYGAAVFPMLIAFGVGALSLLLIISGVRSWRGAIEVPDVERASSGPLKLALAFAAVLFYILAADALGFLICSVLILLALCLVLGVRWWVAALVAVGVTILIHIVFATLLKVPLPLGILPYMGW